MIALEKRIAVFNKLGSHLTRFLENPNSEEFQNINDAIDLAFHKNGWFDRREVLHSISYWSTNLKEDKLEHWLSKYTLKTQSPKSVGIIAAGNIPLVGFHDILCVVLSGNRALVKCSSTDEVLIRLFVDLIKHESPEMESLIEIIPFKLTGFDAIIATGSNNSALHFKQYFGKYPSIIRRNRTGVAILDGTESEEELKGLIEDSYRYYGLGCRNVTKLFLPPKFDLDRIFNASIPFAYLMENKKFHNNYTYHKTLMMMEQRPILENDLLLLVENTSLFSPVSVLNYEFYEDIDALNIRMDTELDNIQCVVGKGNTSFGQAQNPEIELYADGIDTMSFLTKLY